MSKKLLYRIPILIFITFWLIVDCIYPWTEWPHSVVHTTSEAQESLGQSVSIDYYLGNWFVFFYFTILTNIIVVATIILSWVFKVKFTREYKLIVTTYSIITMVVFWTTLAPFMPWGQSWYFDFIYTNEHALIFIIFAFWIWDSPKNPNEAKYKWWKLYSYPIIYLVAQIIFYIAINGKVATYPFLHFTNYFDLGLPLGWSITLAIVTTGAIAAIFGLIFWLLDKFQKHIWSQWVNRT